LLIRRVKLLSFTLVCYPPPFPFVAPQPFVPFAIGEVAFPEGIAIMGQLVGKKYEDLKIGMDVEMIVDKLFEDEQGNEVIGWKFRPSKIVNIACAMALVGDESVEAVA